jgi:amino acid transporter
VFALLGQAGAVAGSAVWLSFLLGGVIAALLGYTVVKLGIRYPSSGGLTAYLIEGFGPGHLAGSVSWLYYFAALIVTSMVAVSFGSYTASLFFGEDATALAVKLLASAIIVAMGAVSIVGAKLIGRVQSTIVVILLAVFAVFIAATVSQMDASLLAPSTYPPMRNIVSSIALTFFAYLGFAVISFTAGDLPEPARNLPRAMIYAIGLTTALYILLSLGVFGTLTVEEVIKNGDTALAVAAIPVLGQAGFTMMSIAAMLATASSVNANLYGAGNMTKSLADQGAFPPVFGGPSRVGGTRGLMITLVLALILTNLFDLSAIASLGSAVALAIFLLLSIAAFRLRAETGSSALIIALGAVSTAVVLAVFAADLFANDPRTLVVFALFVVVSVVLELLWSRAKTRAVPRAS